MYTPARLSAARIAEAGVAGWDAVGQIPVEYFSGSDRFVAVASIGQVLEGGHVTNQGDANLAAKGSDAGGR